MQGLRKHLRDATRDAHDTLDAAMQVFDLHTTAGFARFLQVQYAARAPIEAWCEDNCAHDLTPPAQSELIRQDLANLGIPAPDQIMAFVLPDTADQIGVAWTLAGSSLGNRMILAELDKHGCTEHPRAFLSDPAMPAFWKSLKPQFEREVSRDEADRAVAGALAVFKSFEAALALHAQKVAA